MHWFRRQVRSGAAQVLSPKLFSQFWQAGDDEFTGGGDEVVVFGGGGGGGGNEVVVVGGDGGGWDVDVWTGPKVDVGAVVSLIGGPTMSFHLGSMLVPAALTLSVVLNRSSGGESSAM